MLNEVEMGHYRKYGIRTKYIFEIFIYLSLLNLLLITLLN